MVSTPNFVIWRLSLIDYVSAAVLCTIERDLEISDKNAVLSNVNRRKIPTLYFNTSQTNAPFLDKYT